MSRQTLSIFRTYNSKQRAKFKPAGMELGFSWDIG
jgi:hypothetical protein